MALNTCVSFERCCCFAAMTVLCCERARSFLPRTCCLRIQRFACDRYLIDPLANAHAKPFIHYDSNIKASHRKNKQINTTTTHTHKKRAYRSRRKPDSRLSLQLVSVYFVTTKISSFLLCVCTCFLRCTLERSDRCVVSR